MKLYTSILCPYAHRARITLAEKGLDPEQVEVDPRNKPAELVALGAFGKVPVLAIQGRMISESAVICEFLDEIFKLSPLMPSEPTQRAEARMWIRFADTRLYPHTQQLLYAAPAAERPRLVRELQDDLSSMDEFVSRLQGPYWLGERFSLVDATMLPWFEQCIVIERYRGFAWPEHLTALRRWYARAAERPSVRAVGQSPEFYERAYGALISVPMLTAASK
ncbi:MAG: glutathione S-transferase family protein [Steroidobacteraceae bacterium]|nr:glutathione S-transferase family protein [Steroidobacteraceae bacterium]